MLKITTEVTAKVNKVLGMVKRSFEHLNSCKLLTTLIRPTLEYSNPIWGPHFILDQRKVEKIHRRATKLISSLQDKSYKERPSALSLPSISCRRLRDDLILLFKILNNYFSSDFTDLYIYSSTATRSHQFKQ